MSRAERITAAITSHAKLAIAAMLVLTVLVGAGSGMVEQTSSLDAFQSESTASEKRLYIQNNFSTGSENRTSVQLIVRGGNALDASSLVPDTTLFRSRSSRHYSSSRRSGTPRR
jgi:hypothetical protein